ncbi:MAG: DNA-binding protein [Oscillospiraceae bacterium]|nr:DNA-binding protein [Oscillospiraceae bacterium]
MEYRGFGRDLVLRLDPGEEILSSLKDLAAREDLRLASVRGIGAVNHAVLGLFDPKTKQYQANAFDCDMEIVSLTGTVSRMAGEVYLHLHMAAGQRDGTVVGGHLNEATVSATAELVLTRVDGALDRAFSEEIGLNLLKF